MNESVKAKRTDYVLPLDAAKAERKRVFFDIVSDPLLRRYVRPGMRCLEIGPGLGACTMVIRETLGSTGHLTVVDQGEAFLDVVRVRLEHAGYRDVAFEHAAAETYAFPGDLDLVFGRAVLHHTISPRDICLRAAAALAPGGLMMFQEPVISTILHRDLPPSLVRLVKWFLALGKANGVHLDVGAELAGYAREAGLDIVELSAFCPYLVSRADIGIFEQNLAGLRRWFAEKGIATQAELNDVAFGLRAAAEAGQPLPYFELVDCIAMRPRQRH